MSATPSELRAAAELVLQLTGIPNVVDNIDRWYRIEKPAADMARHILATVRADDGDPVTVGRVRAMGFAPRLTDLGNEYFGAGTPLMAAWYPRKNQWFINGASTEWKPKSMGQLRALLSALGIEVKG